MTFTTANRTVAEVHRQTMNDGTADNAIGHGGRGYATSVGSKSVHPQVCFHRQAGAFICAVAGGFTVNLATLGSAALFAAVLLLFASLTPLLVEPSPHAIGSLFSYLGAIAVVVS